MRLAAQSGLSGFPFVAITPDQPDNRAPIPPGRNSLVHCPRCLGYGCRAIGTEAIEMCPRCDGTGLVEADES